MNIDMGFFIRHWEYLGLLLFFEKSGRIVDSRLIMGVIGGLFSLKPLI